MALPSEKEFQSQIPRPWRCSRVQAGGPQAKSLGPAGRKGAPARDSVALPSEREPWRGRPKKLTGEISRPCRAEKKSRARFLGPGEVPGSSEMRGKKAARPDSFVLARFLAPGWRPTSEIPRPCRAKKSSRARFLCPGEISGSRPEAHRRDPSALPSEKELQSQMPRTWRGFRLQAGGPQARNLGPAERKGAPEPDSLALQKFQAPGARAPENSEGS